MYRKRFTNRTSRRKYDQLDANLRALHADRSWYPRLTPGSCSHGTTWIPDLAWDPKATSGMRVCEDCGVECDIQHTVVGKGYRDSMTDEELANVQQQQRDRIAAHRAMLDAARIESDSSISED